MGLQGLPPQMAQALRILGLEQEFHIKMNSARSFENAVENLAEFKKEASRKRKLLAKQCHPDCGGDLNKMKEINNALDVINKIELERPRPQPVFVQIQVVSGWSSNASTTTSSGYYW